MSKEPTPAEVASGQQSEEAESRTSLARTLGRTTATLMTAAMIVGTGIFGAVGSATSKAGSGILVAMVLGGLIALATGISAAQLGVNYPKEGGAFTWAREFNHKTVGFIAGCAYLGKGIFFSKRHFARICGLFSPNNTEPASTAVRRHRDRCSCSPQFLPCAANNQSVDQSHVGERISIGILHCIFYTRRKPRSFLESVRRHRAFRRPGWSSDILLDLGRLHANRHHGWRNQESTTDHSNRYRRWYCSCCSGFPRRCSDHPRSTRFAVDGER
ncbi:APC family permease [Candidatus Bathyarchaeota archaeon]|nr:MAG: APC family permease [Candidatus Bathyarchaeota archaeon]